MGQTETHDPNIYYVPHASRWPIIATLALGLLLFLPLRVSGITHDRGLR